MVAGFLDTEDSALFSRAVGEIWRAFALIKCTLFGRLQVCNDQHCDCMADSTGAIGHPSTNLAHVVLEAECAHSFCTDCLVLLLHTTMLCRWAISWMWC